jgi:transposase
MRDKYANSKRVDAAVAAIQRGEFTVYADAAREYECDRGAVSRRIRGLTKSRKEALSFWHQCLTDEQEEVLIQRINDLTDRGMPLTSQIVKNLAEEMRGERVNKNWVGQFIKRHGIRLKSLYLRNIDNLRASAEYTLMFQLFFSVVSDFLLLFRVCNYRITANLAWCL